MLKVSRGADYPSAVRAWTGLAENYLFASGVQHDKFRALGFSIHAKV